MTGSSGVNNRSKVNNIEKLFMDFLKTMNSGWFGIFWSHHYLIWSSSLVLYASWNYFPKSVVNLIINKTLNTASITANANNANETNNEVTVYYHVPYFADKGCSWIKSCIRKIKSNCKKEQSITSEFYMMSLKLISPVAPKIKRQH